MLLEKYKTNIDTSVLMEIAEGYKIDSFTQKALEKISNNELFDFLLKKKYDNFLLFVEEFLDFTKYNPKFNTMIKNRNLAVNSSETGIKFVFEVSNSLSYNFESREINYLYDILEDFLHLNPGADTENFLINTNYNEFYIEFYPNWNLKRNN